MSNNVLTQPLKGFRDFLPKDALKRKWLKDKITAVFEKWGYEPMETPTLEKLDIFVGKIGEDESLFYKFKDAGNRDVALRYDQTVPTCRVVAEYFQNLPIPFKRYQIQSAFRAEKPQKGRYREFLQCDADIFGIKSVMADAECIALTIDIYKEIGFKEIMVLINDRELLKDIPYKAIVVIDKIKKIGEKGVMDEMIKKGISETEASKYLNYIKNLKPSGNIKTILNYLENCGFDKNWFKFEPSLARSFSYSSGPIWEVEIPGFNSGSVLGGERYDYLVKLISGKDIPGTGFAIGFDRTLEAAEQFGLVPQFNTLTKILIITLSKQLLKMSLELSVFLRRNGINSEVYPDYTDNISKQLKYANKKEIPYVVFVGENEVKSGKFSIKDLANRKEWNLSKEEIVSLIAPAK